MVALITWFFLRSESKKLLIELMFYSLMEKIDKQKKDFMQRMIFEADIIKYCNQEITESGLQLCIKAGFTDTGHIRDMLPFKTNLT